MYNHALSSERFTLTALVMELVYITDLKSVVFGHAGSSPAQGTTREMFNHR